jgi:ABC-type sugar transport system ATPase subunit
MMLEMRNISKDFSGVRVLKHVNFAVKSGEVHALLGANGAGKSTLIKVLGGQYPDATGTTGLNGEIADLASPRRALLSGIGIVHQEFDIVPELTVAENIYLGFENLKLGSKRYLIGSINRRVIQDAAAALLKEYDLTIKADAVVGKLSVGGQQLVQIARVLALQSDVMIFDEPTARLGQDDRERLFAVFGLLRERGKKVVFVTHYLDEVIAVADRASVMRDGNMIATLDVSDTNIAELSRLMVGEDVRSAEKQSDARFGDPVLVLENLSSQNSFSNVSLEVRSGEIVGIVGHLGSGRHELTRKVLSIATDRSARRRSIVRKGSSKETGFVPEHRRLEGIFPDLSVGANIAVGYLRNRPLFSFVSPGEVKKRAEAIVRTLQVKANNVDQKIAQLSGGNQQKVIFGRSMVSEPELYVIEAPTVGVDVKAAVELHNEIFSLARKGSAILLATDDLDEVLLLSDRIFVMLRGRVVREFDAKSLTRQQLVASMGAA